MQNELRRKEEISQIQGLYQQGLSKTVIAKLLRTSPKRVRKYLKGDPDHLCKHGGKGKIYGSDLDTYSEKILNMLHNSRQQKEIFEVIAAEGYAGSYSTLCQYCKNLKQTNNIGTHEEVISKKFLCKQDFFKYIWSGKALVESDRLTVYEKYSELSMLEECVKDFRNIFSKKDILCLYNFIEKYRQSRVSNIKSFVSGLLKDIKAVENAVISPYSNGVTEGNNHRLKLIKRVMYGRAKLPLLRAKVLPASIFYTQ